MPATVDDQETIKLLIAEVAKLNERVYCLENQRLAHHAILSIVTSHLGQIGPSAESYNSFLRDYAEAVEAPEEVDEKVVRRRLAVATEIRAIANAPGQSSPFRVILGGKIDF